MEHYIQAIVIILSLVNPVICGAIFSGLTAGRPFGARVSSATSAMLVVAAILSLAALAGAKLLQVFGISLDAFQAAGGLVLMWMGFLMLSGGKGTPASATTGDGTAATAAVQPSMAPLILFAASPGTITGVITISVAHAESAIPVTALVAIGAAMAVTWLILVVSARTAGGKKPGPMHDLTPRFMGLIVLAMGVQFLLAGVKAFFAVAGP
ncbi:MAG: MarC family protein [Woeseiaceae bacterium]